MWKPGQAWYTSSAATVAINSSPNTAPTVDFKTVHPAALQAQGTVVGAVSGNIDFTQVTTTLVGAATQEIDSDLIPIPNMSQILVIDVEFFTKLVAPGGFTAGDYLDLNICLIVGPGPVTLFNLVNVLANARVFVGTTLTLVNPPAPSPFLWTGTGKCTMAYAGITTGPSCDGGGGGLDPNLVPNYDATVAVVVTPNIAVDPLICDVHIAVSRVIR